LRRSDGGCDPVRTRLQVMSDAMPPRKRKDKPILSEAHLSLVLEMFREHPEFRMMTGAYALGLELGDTLRYGELLEHLKQVRTEKRITMARAARTLGVRVAQLRVIESGPVSEIEPEMFRGYMALVAEPAWFERWKRAHPALAARLEGAPPPPIHPWIGRPAEFKEAADPSMPPRPDPRTARVLKEARARYPQVYRLRVALAGIRPPIWRRVVVAGGATLHELHLALQESMGWQMSHLYEFSVPGLYFLEPDPDESDDRAGIHDSRIVLLGDLGLSVGGRFRYLYDFGDGWEHDIRVEDIGDYDAAQPVPSCIDGRRACPPEDVGGIGGYAEMLVALADPEHEEHKSISRWLGGQYDPERFESRFANSMLKREQALWRKRLGG
jgi:hypothetical protein